MLREEALRDDHEEVDREPERGKIHEQRQEAMAHGDVQHPLVALEHDAEAPLGDGVEPAVADLLRGLQEARCHHWRQRQGDERGDSDGHADGDRELAEQPPDDAAHQEQRDEHRDQRDADRQDGEADLTAIP